MVEYEEQIQSEYEGPDFSTLKYIYFSLEIECPPIWWSDGVRTYNDFPDDIEDDDDLWKVLVPLQMEFEETCFDKNWDVLGFPTDEAMEAFNAKWKTAYEFTKERLKGRYQVLEPAYFQHRINDVYP